MSYIARETALQIIDNYAKTVSKDGKVVVDAIRDIVEVITPTADVVSVRHGEWKIMKIGDGERVRTCSQCIISQSVNVYKNKVMFRYCPYCGAKMDLERSKTDE